MALPPPDTVSRPMENSMTSIAAARRNLAQSVERSSPRSGKASRPVGEATNIAAALACLESGRCPEGEDAMMLAEKDWPPRGELGTAVAVEVLAERFAEL